MCGSALEHAPVPRKTSRIRRSRLRRLKRPLAPARRSAAVCGGLGSRAKKEPKKAYRDFQAIRRKGVVQGQSRQALMSWRTPTCRELFCRRIIGPVMVRIGFERNDGLEERVFPIAFLGLINRPSA